jgi:hypothetical protein
VAPLSRRQPSPAARAGSSTPPAGGRASRSIALATGAAGAIVAAATLPALASAEPGPLLLLIGLVVLTRIRTLPVYGRGSYSVSTVPVLAAAILLGAGGAVAVALVSGLTSALLRRLAWHKALFNCGTFALAAALAAAVFHAFGAELRPDNLARLIAIAALAGLAHYSHTFLTALAIAAEHGTSPLSAWREHFGWLWPQYPILGAMALLLALSERQFGLAGAAAFAAPPAMMLYTAKQYVDHTSRRVQEVRTLRGELSALAGRLDDAVERGDRAEAEVARLRLELARAADPA